MYTFFPRKVRLFYIVINVSVLRLTFFSLKHTPVETKWPDLEAHSSKPITKMSERPSIQTPTSDYSTMETTFRERLAEPAPIEEKLERSNYQEKFHKLLFSEEKEHIQVLQKRFVNSKINGCVNL